jgi:hypothetical protein
MAIPAMIVALAEQWDRVDAALRPDTRERLRELVVALADSVDHEQRVDLRAAIARVLFEGLPDDDPVVKIGNRFSGPAAALEPALAEATTSIRLRLADRAPWSAYHRILTTSCEDIRSLRRRGIDPDIPHLIRLDRVDGSVVIPSFQLDDAGHPTEFVLRVNRLLGAQDDPWGAADWWLSTNSWLHEPPVRLLPRPGRESVVAAAVAAMEG